LLHGDSFILKTGGRVEGVLHNSDQSPRQQFIIRTSKGSQITLAAHQVDEVIRKTASETHYENIVMKVRDVAKDHWKMAEWCQENQLHRQREFHLERIVALEHDHAEARRALGFTLRNGKWIRPKEWMKAHGYIHHKGAWRTRQDVALQRDREEYQLAQKDYRRKLKIWRGWIGRRRDQQARGNFQEINDPRASWGLAKLLETEQDPRLRHVFVDALGRSGGPDATNALIRHALEDPSEAIRDQCLTKLKIDGSQAAVRTMINVLRHKSNVKVNRAATGLSRLQNLSAVLPLIQALETNHRFVIKGRDGGINPSFGNGGAGGGGLTIGDSGTKIIKKKFRNHNVLTALVELTGKNFNFDLERWLHWYTEKEAPPRATLRRDA